LQTLLVVEARFGYLPIGDQNLDVLIMSCGLPKGDQPLVTLKRLRRLLKPGGLLVWPHPVTDGLRGQAGRLADLFRRETLSAVCRRQLCAWTMEAGFGEVGQEQIQGLIFPWVVTIGRAGNRPWEDTEKRSGQ
jgi:ubiquinone/menaquinone biosynthesis C-methylase UbiE